MTKRLIDTFCRLVSIDSVSFHEEKMIEFLTEYLKNSGIEAKTDDMGNIYAYIKGSIEGEPILLSAHTDTVSPGIGKKAVVHGDGKITSDGNTVLGADDAAGLAAILEALTVLKEKNIPHRDIELLLPAAEEVYIKGTSAFDFSVIRSKTAFVLDLDGRVGNAAFAAPGLISFEIKIKGRSAHAGFAPENGINAIAAAAEAITLIKQGRPDEISTLNIGTISGGTAANIVSGECIVKGEVRSLEQSRAAELFENVKKVFGDTAKKYGAEAEIKHCVDLTAYNTPKDGRAAKLFENACRKCGIEPKLITTFGGSDNNNFALHGIEGLVLAVGYVNAHTCGEYIYIKDLEAVTNIILKTVEV